MGSYDAQAVAGTACRAPTPVAFHNCGLNAICGNTSRACGPSIHPSPRLSAGSGKPTQGESSGSDEQRNYVDKSSKSMKSRAAFSRNPVRNNLTQEKTSGIIITYKVILSAITLVVTVEKAT